MKKLVSAAALCCILISGGTLAHADHGTISSQQAVAIAVKSVQQMTFKDSQQAVAIAVKSVQQMTFKDFGFAVGKLNASWKEPEAKQFSVVSIEEGFYIVSAVNSSKAEQVFFKIANNGQILDVKPVNDF
ncbi:MAG: hypothetical protein B7X50_12455 [Alishewanella sp. 34-51-39]|nr:MAG: hypothetical protein B7X50_12455 [Alishewanella sp. 34-51-39]